MRSKITVKRKVYKVVPWLATYDCVGCALEDNGCLQADGSEVCGQDGEFNGYIFIASGKEALAKYVLARLEKAS